MIKVLCREFGMVWALGLSVMIASAGLVFSGAVVHVPVVDRGFPGSWLAASGAALLAWYMLRPRWQREVAQLVRARWHRAVVIVSVAILVGLALLPIAFHSVDVYEVTLYPLLFATAVIGAIAAGNLGWAPILVVSLGAQTANNVSLREVSQWVNLHADLVVSVGAVVLLGALVFYVWHGAVAGFPSPDD